MFQFLNELSSGVYNYIKIQINNNLNTISIYYFSVDFYQISNDVILQILFHFNNILDVVLYMYIMLDMTLVLIIVIF
jgi:hypothetical protein